MCRSSMFDLRITPRTNGAILTFSVLSLVEYLFSASRVDSRKRFDKSCVVIPMVCFSHIVVHACEIIDRLRVI